MGESGCMVFFIIYFECIIFFIIYIHYFQVCLLLAE
uniref:Uncharacterized protein n=1 Tax=Anguilla anguilla TaxID=7936 RepID=A0A0E9PBY4_ANGAN